MSNIAHFKKNHNDPLWSARVELTAAFRWAVRHNWHEAVANHFSLAINEAGTQFLINPNQRHFSLLKASDLLLVDVKDSSTFEGPYAPDPTAWGLHGAIHRLCPHARCALHVHSRYATILASLKDSTMPPIDQNTAMFFNRIAIDEQFDGLSLGEEAERCCSALKDQKQKVLVMGNHGIMVIGSNISDAFNRLYYFERAAETLIMAYMTGKPLRIMDDTLAEKTARELNEYPEQAQRHFSDMMEILDREEPEYAS